MPFSGVSMYLFALMLLYSCYDVFGATVDFGPNKTGIFVSNSECNSEDFKIDKYENYQNITPPYASTGYFLRVDNAGCFVTNPYHFEDDSQIVVIYRVMSPGIKLKILIGTNVYKPPMNSKSWETFVQIINNVSGYAQVKFVTEWAPNESERPLIIIDRFIIMPPLHPVFTASLKPTTRKSETPKMKMKSTTVKPITNKTVTKLVSPKSTQPTLSTRSESKTYETYPTLHFITTKGRILKPTENPLKQHGEHVKDKIFKWKQGPLKTPKARVQMFRADSLNETSTISVGEEIIRPTTAAPPNLAAIKFLAVMSIIVSVAAITVVFCIFMFICNFRHECNKKVDKKFKKTSAMADPSD